MQVDGHLALQLVRQLEQWFELMAAEYAYIATDKSNEASLRLFTGRCGYTKFRTLSPRALSALTPPQGAAPRHGPSPW